MIVLSFRCLEINCMQFCSVIFPGNNADHFVIPSILLLASFEGLGFPFTTHPFPSVSMTWVGFVCHGFDWRVATVVSSVRTLQKISFCLIQNCDVMWAMEKGALARLAGRICGGSELLKDWPHGRDTHWSRETVWEVLSLRRIHWP